MTRMRREEKLASMRLAAVLEKLHGIAHDPATPEDEAIKASTEMGRTILKHYDLIVASLKAV